MFATAVNMFINLFEKITSALLLKITSQYRDRKKQKKKKQMNKNKDSKLTYTLQHMKKIRIKFS